nr:GNAT family N-acetyltransferase [Erythrobacter sp. F6033]
MNQVADGVFDEDIKPERLERYLSNPLNWMVVAVFDEVVVGQCMSVVHHHPDKEAELYLDEIGTGDDWRRRGIAKTLMKEVTKRADAEGIDEIWLGTEPDNIPAMGLYEGTGAVGEEALIYYLEW